MSRLVQARLDQRTARMLLRLRRVTGANDSEIVRRGIAALCATIPESPAQRIRGLGRFASGREDLGSNKKHLDGFGRW
jgi:hypothetical protein